MDIIFKRIEDEKCKWYFEGAVEGNVAGHLKLFSAYPGELELYDFQMTEWGKEHVDRAVFMDSFCAYLKEKESACKSLRLESEKDKVEDWLGFKLDDWDNSGWYPKYFFKRAL